eukprot:gene17705-9364_t
MDAYKFAKSCFCCECIEKLCYKRSYQTRYRQHDRYGDSSRRIPRNHNSSAWRCGPYDEKKRHDNKQCQWNQIETNSLAVQSVPQFIHPVKLIWPKKPYDYMFAEGEKLLRDFPVQATLEFVSDADSDSEDDDYDVDAEDKISTKTGETEKN